MHSPSQLDDTHTGVRVRTQNNSGLYFDVGADPSSQRRAGTNGMSRDSNWIQINNTSIVAQSTNNCFRFINGDDITFQINVQQCSKQNELAAGVVLTVPGLETH